MNSDAVIPWSIDDRHSQEWPARMLRLIARKRAGEPLDLRDQQRLQRWRRMLDQDRAVVAYCPAATPGFYYVLANEPEDAPDGVPVRPRLLSAEELPDPSRQTAADFGVKTGSSTAGVFEWYCDVHDTYGNADSLAEAEHVAAAHAEFFFLADPDDEPCDVLTYQTK